MPTARRRPETEFESTAAQAGQQIVTLSGLTGGINTYTNPELLSPQFWAACSNIYSGQHGNIRRARWAPLLNSSTVGYLPTTVRMTSMFGAYFPLQNPWLFFDTNGAIWWLDGLSGIPVATPLNQSLTLFYLPAWDLEGPFMRLGMGGAMIFQTNGLARSKIFVNQTTNQPNLELWGIDAPDAAPNIVMNPFPNSYTISTITSSSGFVRVEVGVAPGTQVGQFITIYGVADPTFDSAAGTADQIVAEPLFNSMVYESPGPDRSSSGGFATDGIVKKVGRSYSYAWENANTGQVSAPSPATVYVLAPGTPGSVVIELSSVASGTGVYTGSVPAGGSNFYVGYFFQVTGFTNAANNGSFPCTASSTTTLTLTNPNSVSETNAGLAQAYENVTIEAIEPGRINSDSSSPMISGSATAFSQAWVGRTLWGSVAGILGQIASVTSPTLLTLAANAAYTAGDMPFQVVDPQVTHIRFYATGDGQATYLRIARNVFVPNTGMEDSGLQFVDTANSEPPNPPFTNELAQIQNVPPPIGTYEQDYQGRILVFGIEAIPQGFVYSNIESTTVGQPPESFAPLNVVTLPIGDGALKGMANLPTGCMIWSNRQDMFKLTGTLTDNTIATTQQLASSIQRLPYRIGCASPYATTVTSLGAFWLSSDREVWLFTDHYAPKNVGKPIQNILNQATRIQFARMENYKSGDRNWIALALTIPGPTSVAGVPIISVSTVAYGMAFLATYDAPNHGLTAGQTITIADVIPGYFNGVFTVDTVIDSSHFTVLFDLSTGLFTGTGGTVYLGDITPQFNNTLCLLDLDLLASNGQPSFFTFDMATNQPSWYIYNINCEAIEAAFDAISINHLLVGDVDLITDVDWQPSYYTVGFEQSIPNPGVTLHAVGNEDPEVIKTGKWMRVTTNQLPKLLASQGWYWNVLVYDDDKYVLTINPQTVPQVPGVNSQSSIYGLETSPSLFKFGARNYVKGRRFQLQTVFPSGPGFYELRSFQFCYDQIVSR